MPTTSRKTASSGKATSSANKSSEKRKEPGSKSGDTSEGNGRGTSKAAGRSTKSESSKSNSSSGTGSSKSASKSANSGSKKRAASGGAKRTSSRSKSDGSTKSSTGRSASSKVKSTRSGKSQATRPSKSSHQFVSGEKDVLDLLKEDHRTVDEYFKEIKAAEDANHEGVFKKIKSELDVHAHVEEVIFYPHLLEAGSVKLKKIVREGIEEHSQVKTLLAELAELKGTDKVFKAKLTVLMENVEHHVEEEEDEMFSLVEDEFDENTRLLLGDRVEKEKAKFAKTGTKKPAKAKAATTARKSGGQ